MDVSNLCVCVSGLCGCEWDCVGVSVLCGCEWVVWTGGRRRGKMHGGKGRGIWVGCGMPTAVTAQTVTTS